MPNSSASAGSSGGRIPGMRAASIDLPEPGGPIIKRLWPPAAAISSARFALSWPLTSLRSSPAARDGELRRGRRQQLGPLEMVDDREEARRRDDLDVSGPGCFAPALQRADDAAVARGGGEGGEQ